MGVTMAALLASCGGGGSGGSGGTAEAPPPPTGAPARDPNAYPAVAANAGDWYVYAQTINVAVPVGSPSSERTHVRYEQTVGADGSFTRVDTFSADTALATQRINGAGARTEQVVGSSTCTFSPAYQGGPATTSKVGDSFSGSSTETCVHAAPASTTTRQHAYSGQNVGLETRQVPLGSFPSFKVQQTLTTESASTRVASQQTCWIDTTLGRPAACETHGTATSLTSNTVVSEASNRLELVAYQHRGVTRGAAVRRFHGGWRLVFGGTHSGDCANLAVDATGVLSGSCRVLLNDGAGETTVTLAGAISAGGAASLNASSGATLTGSFDTPFQGSGTWTNGSASGTWTATHL